MRDIVRSGVVLFLITLVAAVALGAVYKVTEGPIAAQREAQTGSAALKKYIPSATRFEELDAGMFDKVDKYFVAYENDQEAGYIVNLTVKGYGGDVELLVVINADGQIQDFVLLKHSETAGLGANAEKPEFAEQYKGKSGPFTVVTGAASGENDIEALSSATITTSAVTQGVNRALTAYSVYQDVAAGGPMPNAGTDPNAPPFQKYVPSATSFEEIDSGKFNEINSFTVAYENDKEIGYVAEVTVKGFGGDVEFLVVLDEAGKVGKIVIVDHQETPGLGAKVEEAGYTDQYTGKGGPFTVVTGGASSENDIEAIAGATITSEVVTAGVNKVLSMLAVHQGIEPEPVEEEDSSASPMEKYFPSATSFEEIDANKFDGVDSFTAAYVDGQEEGYIVGVTTKGFAGDIELLVVLDKARQVEDIVFVSLNETPGLGSKADDPAYIGQYKGKGALFNVVAGSAVNANDVEAITGATVTSNAVTQGVNNALLAVSAHTGIELEASEEGAEPEEPEEEESVDDEAPQKEAQAASSPMQKYIPSATKFEEVNTGSLNGVSSFTIGYENDQEAGCVVSVSPSGFAGPIELIVVLDKSGQIQDVVVISQNETPGLGGRITEPEFISQFKGKSGSVGSDIDAIASATISSDAFKQGVNNALSAYQDVIIKGVR